MVFQERSEIVEKLVNRYWRLDFIRDEPLVIHNHITDEEFELLDPLSKELPVRIEICAAEVENPEELESRIDQIVAEIRCLDNPAGIYISYKNEYEVLLGNTPMYKSGSARDMHRYGDGELATVDYLMILWSTRRRWQMILIVEVNPP